MGNIWLKIWVWTKVSIFGLLALYLLAFIFKNSDRTVEIWYWFFKDSYKVTILFFTFFVFMGGVIGTILVGTTIKTIHQIRNVQSRNRSDKLHREVADMKAKAAMLQTKPEPAAPTAPSDHISPTP
jgi:uncharacterized integral membrane protein